MLFTLFINPISQSIVLWGSVPNVNYFRAFFWLLGAFLLPGHYLVKFLPFLQMDSLIEKTAIKINLSIIFNYIFSSLLYFGFDISKNIDIFYIISLVGLFFVSREIDERPAIMSSRDGFLLGILGFAVLCSFVVFLTHNYLIPGDVWVSLQPAVQLISGLNPTIEFRDVSYPFGWGVILALLSNGSGLPVVNTYAALFPCVIIFPLTVFLFMKKSLNMDENRSIITIFFLLFTGGLGWIVSYLSVENRGFWGFSLITQDMYFSNTWGLIQFSYKSIAYTAVIFALYLLLTLSDMETIDFKYYIIPVLFLVLAFHVHMIELLVFIPLSLYIVFSRQGKKPVLLFSFLLGLILIIFDVIFDGYYVWLSFNKFTNVFLNWINPSLFISSLFFVLIILFLSRFSYNNYFIKIKQISVIYEQAIVNKVKIHHILLIWVLGFIFWFYYPKNDVYNNTIWPFFYTTKFGIIGIFALVGVFKKSNYHNKDVIKLWFLLSIFLGYSFWSRMFTFISFIVSLYASTGIMILIDHILKYNKKIFFIIDLYGNERELSFKLNKLLGIILLFSVILSMSSPLYMTYHYSTQEVGLSNELAQTFSWLYSIIKQNEIIIVPKGYTNRVGTQSICNAKIEQIDFNAPTSERIEQAIENASYFLVTENVFDNPITKLIIQESILCFRTNGYRVYSVNIPETKEGVLKLGLSDSIVTTKYFDDYTFDAWNYSGLVGVNTGSSLKLFGELDKESEVDLFAVKNFPTLYTSEFDYFVIRYRNPDNCIDTTQFINFYDKEGGFIDRIFLDFISEGNYTFKYLMFSPGQKIASMELFIRNGNTGDYCLEIDYIGFISFSKGEED